MTKYLVLVRDSSNKRWEPATNDTIACLFPTKKMAKQAVQELAKGWEIPQKDNFRIATVSNTTELEQETHIHGIAGTPEYEEMFKDKKE